MIMLMVPLRVRHQQALHNAADRGLKRSNEQVKVIVQQTIAEQIERLALFQINQRFKKGLEVARLSEDRLPIVAAVNDMIDQAVSNGSQRAGHER
jgi:hypothetical protein